MRFPMLPAFVLAVGVATLGRYLAQNPPPPPAGAAFLPNPALTPGATLPVTKEQVCRPGYSQQVRHVPESEKRAVYRAYGMTRPPAGPFEVDHLISLELGGSNDVQNLWPESYLTRPWNAHVKDALENALHREVCSGQLSLEQAQTEIRTDWIQAYRRHFHTDLPAPVRSLPTPPLP